jgi:hypothetical protein
MIASTKLWAGVLVVSVVGVLLSLSGEPGNAAISCNETTAPTCGGGCEVWGEECVAVGSSCECVLPCGSDTDSANRTNGTEPVCSGFCPPGMVCRQVEDQEACETTPGGAGESVCASEVTDGCGCVPERGIVNSMLNHQR